MSEKGQVGCEMSEPTTAAERCAAGLWYDSSSDELVRLRLRAKDLCFELNRMRPSDERRREELLRALLGELGEKVEILSPLVVDYGTNCRIGDGSFVNHGAYLMDCAPITIGRNVFVGPGFGAYTAQHPLVAEERNRGLERALPIAIGDDCWLGGDVKVMPGVTIGAGCVIGAGSVVTRDVPAGMLAVGVPCRPVRPVTDADRIS